MQWTKVLCLAGLATLCNGKPLNQGKTLVVGEEQQSTTYQDFFKRLQDGGYDLDIKNVRDESIDLLDYERLAYDNVVLFPTKTKSLGPKLTSKKLMEFFNKGGNILAITNEKSVPESVRELAAELDINISPKGFQVVDHFNGEGDKHNIVPINDFPLPDIASSSSSLKYSGGAAYLGNGELILPIALAPRTAFAYDARDDATVVSDPWVSGNQAALVAGFQGRNNARFLWVGSDKLFIDHEATEFADDLAKWTFYEKGVIKSTFVEHHLKDSEILNEKLYKVSEDITYSVGLCQWDGEQFSAYDADDVQLEFVMLDPYYRLTLEKDDNRSTTKETVYTTTFKIPDQYGMFTFRVKYERAGLSNVEESEVVTIRHIANDEWPRSWEITNSWVYLTSAVSVVGAWLIFVVFYLYTGQEEKTK